MHEESIEYSTLVEKFENFLEDIHNIKYVKAIQDLKPIIINYKILEKFDKEFFNYFLQNPEECFQAINDAIINTCGIENIENKIHLQIKNLPITQKIRIIDLRSSHLGKFISVEGFIKKIEKVTSKITFVIWECEACGEKIKMYQDGYTLEKPYMCECGNKKNFQVIEYKKTDFQQIVISESLKKSGSIISAGNVSVSLNGDLVNQVSSKIDLGKKVNLTGIVKDKPMKIIGGKETTIRDFIIECNYIEFIEIEQDCEDLKEDSVSIYDKITIDFLRIIKEMQDESSDKLVNREDLISRAEEEGMDSAKVEEIIESLRRDGELFEPKPGFIIKV